MEAFLGNPIALLLVVLVLGDLLGRLRFRGLSLGSSAVLVVALAAGHFGYRLPSDLRSLGLVLFIYSVGLEAGPGFVAAFRRHGLALTLGAVAMVATGAAATLVCSLVYGFDEGTAAGLLAGALTSTPGLAIAVEAVDGPAAPAAYGVTYSFGVLGVVLFVRLLPRLLRADLTAEKETLREELAVQNPPITFHNIEVVNPNLFGRTVGDIRPTDVAPVTITRLLRRGATSPVLVNADTVLEEGDRLRIVGREEDLARAELLLGQPMDGLIEFERALENRRAVVSNPAVVGRPLGSFDLPGAFNVQVSRIVRSGVELAPKPARRLQLGDRLTLVGGRSSLRNVTRMLGDSQDAAHIADVPPLLLGLLLGYLLGQVPIPIPGVGEISLGASGGVLVAGLVLGRLHKTGPFQWQLPHTANTFVRNLGLLLFLAVVGTSAGASVVETLREQGAALLLSGLIVTTTPLLIGAIVCRYALHLPVLRVLGVLAGGMTSTPGLAATADLPGEGFAAGAYATVYPAALLGMILAVKGVTMLL